MRVGTRRMVDTREASAAAETARHSTCHSNRPTMAVPAWTDRLVWSGFKFRSCIRKAPSTYGVVMLYKRLNSLDVVKSLLRMSPCMKPMVW